MTITQELIAQLQAREAKGIEAYGETLKPFNGRDACQDLIEELLDAAQYARQWQEERVAMVAACRRAELALRPDRVWPNLMAKNDEFDTVWVELRAVLAQESKDGA